MNGQIIDRADFDAAYEALKPASTRRLVRSLGVHPGEAFSVELAATLANVEVAQACRMLDDIRVHALLAVDEHGWYRFTPEVRVHLHDAIGQQESEVSRDNAFLVIVHWYIAVARQIAATIVPGRQALSWRNPLAGGLVVEPAGVLLDRSMALGWMDREHGNAAAVVRAAVHRGLPDEAVWLADALQPYYLVRDCGADAVGVDELVLRAAWSLGDDDLTIHILERASCRYARIGDHAHASLHLDTMTGMLRDDSDSGHVASTQHARGVFLVATGHATDAIQPLREAALLRNTRGNAHDEALALHEFGKVLLDTGQHDRAVAALNRAHELLSGAEVVDRYSRACIDITGALARLRMRDTSGVRSILDDALATMVQWDNPREEARAQDGLAELADLLGHHSAAAHHRAVAGELRSAASTPTGAAVP